MKKIQIVFLGSILILLNQAAFAAETETVQTLTKPPIVYDDQRYGDRFETTWSTSFKKTGSCKNAQLKFTSKRFLGAPEERALMYGFYFYSADFRTILAKEGMYSKKLENKSGRITFDFFMLDEAYKGGKLPADVLSKCLTLNKNFKSPLQLHYFVGGKAPHETDLIAAVAFKEKK